MQDYHLVEDRQAREALEPQPTRRHGAPKLAIVTTAYNEAAGLPVWRDHRRRPTPTAERFLIDHGSDQGRVVNLCRASRVAVPRTEMDAWAQARLVRRVQASLRQYFSIVIYCDCDELVAADPTVLPPLEANLARDHRYASPVGPAIQPAESVG